MDFKKILQYLLYGLLLWAALLLYSFFVYYLKEYSVALFDSLMFIAIALFTMLFSFVIFRRKKTEFFKTGIVVGILWMLENLFLDMFIFHWGPFKMSFTQYFTEIGISYITLPIIVAGTGYLLDKFVKKIHYDHGFKVVNENH